MRINLHVASAGFTTRKSECYTGAQKPPKIIPLMVVYKVSKDSKQKTKTQPRGYIFRRVCCTTNSSGFYSIF